MIKMSITSGFFNSVNGDRTYNADQMSMYFKGLVSNGVFENVGGAMQVLAGTDMTVQVQTGRAVIGDNLKWVENDAVLDVSVNASHVTLNRYTAVVIQLDLTNREVDIITVDGANATNPVKPTMTNNTSIKQLCLAYIYVGAGVTAITQSNIQDTRANTNLCGWITGLIDQVDTTTLFDQWEAAYNENVTEMESWESSRKAAFDSWMSTLTSELTVGAYIKEYEKNIQLDNTSSTTIALDWDGYTYESTDIVFVFINGLLAKGGYDYHINTQIDPIGIDLLNIAAKDEWIDIKILKTVLGVSS